MTTYYKRDDEAERLLLKDLQILLDRSGETHTLVHTTQNDFKNQKEWLEKEKNNSKTRKAREYEKQLNSLEESMKTYDHIWILQIKRTGGFKFANKALTVIYKARIDGVAQIDIGETKYAANVGKAAIGTALLFAGPVGWIVGGSLGFSAFSGTVMQKDMNDQIKKLIGKHLEEDDIQYFY